jgi:hypothetical protein
MGDEAILIHLETSQIYELNPSGARVWDCIADGLDQNAILARLLTEFDADEADLRRDLDELVASLTAAGLIDGSGR